MKASKEKVSKNMIEDDSIIGVEFDENGDPVEYYTPVELFDELDRKFVDFYGEYGRRMVNEDRERWNRDGLWHFDLF